jgi:hypothetical protein
VLIRIFFLNCSFWLNFGKIIAHSCRSRNFSITTENAAKPAQPTHAPLGPAVNKNMNKLTEEQ